MSKINQRLEQGQKLNPKQIIEANLMQMNLATLEKRILEEIESNPVLDIADDEQDYNDEDNTDDSDFNWEDLISNPEDYSMPSSSRLEAKDDYERDYSKPTLVEDFMVQLNDLNINESELQVAEYILGNLDDRGYLTIEPIVISDKTGLSEEKILSLINTIKGLDPPGVGSSNLQDLQTLQIFRV